MSNSDKPWEADSQPTEPANAGTEIPPKPEVDINQTIGRWWAIKQKLQMLNFEEKTLRSAIVKHFFPDPVEGTNTQDMPKGWKLKLTHKLERKIDEAALDAVLEKLPEGSRDKLVRFKPELNKRGYNALHEVQKEIFEEALITKPASPQLTLVEPKEKKI